MTDTIHDPVTVTHVPHPGSRMDAVSQAAQQESPVIEMTDTDGETQFVVDVKVVSPELGYPQCYPLSANNQVALILSHDPLRRNALILAVDSDIYLCGSKEAAQAVAGTSTGTTGFYLTKGVLMAVPSKGSVWAACTTNSGNSRVSVFVSRDD